jgi:hypothetical protein
MFINSYYNYHNYHTPKIISVVQDPNRLGQLANTMIFRQQQEKQKA